MNTGKEKPARELVEPVLGGPGGTGSDSGTGGSAVREEAPDVGPNWAAMFWILILAATLSILLAGVVIEIQERQRTAGMRIAALGVESDVRDIAYQSLLAVKGADRAFDRLTGLRAHLGREISSLDPRVLEEYGNRATDGLRAVTGEWSRLDPLVALLVSGHGVVGSTLTQVDAVDSLVPELAARVDGIVDRLIENEASLELIGLGNRQRLLVQQVGAGANEFAAGGVGWRRAAGKMQDDVRRFGETSDAIRGMGGVAVAGEMAGMDTLYQQLVSSVAGITGNAGDYITMLDAAARIEGLSASMQKHVAQIIRELDAGPERPAWVRNLPLMLAAAGSLGLIGLIWSVVRHGRRRERADAFRKKRSRDAVTALLEDMDSLAHGNLAVKAEMADEATDVIADSMNFAIGKIRTRVSEIRSASEELTAEAGQSGRHIEELLANSDAQAKGIADAAREIERMSETINRLGQSALHSSKRAREAGQTAKDGAGAIRDTVEGMNAIGSRVRDTAARLGRLQESSRRINEIVSLIRDVTEQTNVLSLNASIQASMAGDSGKGFAVIADEAQRLAERSARASDGITDIVKTIQQDAREAILSMESTTGEVTAGASVLDEAGRAIAEIERVGQELLAAIESLATEAAEESDVANRVSRDMDDLRRAALQSGLGASQVAAVLGNIRGTLEKLDRAVAGFRLPD